MCSSEGAVEGIETAGTKNQNEPVCHALHFAILELVTSPIYSYGLLVVVVDISSAVEVRTLGVHPQSLEAHTRTMSMPSFVIANSTFPLLVPIISSTSLHCEWESS